MMISRTPKFVIKNALRANMRYGVGLPSGNEIIYLSGKAAGGSLEDFRDVLDKNMYYFELDSLNSLKVCHGVDQVLTFYIYPGNMYHGLIFYDDIIEHVDRFYRRLWTIKMCVVVVLGLMLLILNN